MNFYIKYYRVIHHIISLIIFWFVFLVGGINLLDVQNFMLTLFIIAINYPISNWCIKKSGIEEMIEEEKRK